MRSYFDDLEAQLRSAARARAGASAPAGRDASRRRRRRREWLRVAPVLASALVAVAVVGAALLLLGRGHGAASGSRPPRGGIGALIAHTPRRQLDRELGYVFAATRSVQNSKACQIQHPTTGPTYINGSPGSDLLSILGVLRRPATPADRLGPQPVGPIPDIYRAYVRRAFSAGGVSYYIVPSRFDRAAVGPSGRCLALLTAAINRYLPRVPASLRRPTREIGAAYIAYLRTLGNGPRDRISLLYYKAGTGGGASSGITAKGIEEGFATLNALGGPEGTFSGVVPDGVATVTLVFPAVGRQPAHAVSTRVKGNLYAVNLQIHGSPPSPTVIWRSPEGRVLKRVSTSNAANLARICKLSPVACLLARAVSGSSSISTGAKRVRSAPARRPGG